MLIYGVGPVFFAFMFSGYCMFHEHDKFDTLTKTNATLEAVMAGDEVLDLIGALMLAYGGMGLAFGLGFCVLFIICIHNTLVYIIGESFKENFEVIDREQKSIQKFNRVQSTISTNSLRHTESHGDVRDFLVSESNFEPAPVIQNESDVNFVKNKVFNKIIPQSREKHIHAMSTRRDMIKADIRFLKESIQDLMKENLSRCHSDPGSSVKEHLKVSSVLYVEFLLKRLSRMSTATQLNEKQR